MKIKKQAAVLLLILSLGGCQKVGDTPSSRGGWPAEKATSAGNYIVRIGPVATDSIKRNKHFSLQVVLKPGRTGEFQKPEKINVDADMPAHRHGMNTKPEILEIEPGHYQVDGMLFHMAGDWVITVKMDPGTGHWEKADFPVSIE